MASGVTVTDDPDAHRYVVSLDGHEAGFAQYRSKPGLIAFVHTEIDDHLEGRGLASALISYAFDDARDRGLAVLPFCPFVNDYIVRHRDYADLVPVSYREKFGL